MASEWREVRLGDVVELKRGYDLPQQDRRPGKFPLVSSSGVTDYVSSAMVKGPGVVTGRYGTLGQVFYIAEDFWPLNTTLYIRDFKGNDPRFISYLLRTIDVRAFSDKAAVPGLNRNHLHQAIVRLPSDVAEQRAIAHILGTLDDKIELNRRINETLEAMARALFKSWFVDFDPIRAKATGRQPVGMNAELAAQFPDRFEATDLGNVPAEWKRASFGTIAENWRHAIDPQDLAPDTPYIGLEHMRTKSLSLDIWGTAGSVTSGKTRFQRGDVLFGRLRPYFHKVGIAFTDGVCSTDILVIRAKRPEWYGIAVLVASSDEMVRFADSRSTGTRMPRVSWKDLAQFPVVLPPDRVARAFDALVSPLLEKLRANALQSRTLAALRDALLPKLVSGEIRVSAAAPLVESVL